MSNLSTVIQLHPNVKAALIHPERFMEVRGWLKGNALIAQQWKGSDGETMMHWAFLSNWVLAAELKEIGLTYDATDNFGRTPMDWVNDRMWYAVVEDNTKGQLSAGGQERLRRHSEQQIEYLWAQGARPSFSARFIHPGVVWMRAGSWALLNLLKENEEYSWFHWAPQGGHALHSWILSPNTPQRRDFLKKWDEEFSVDLGDTNNRSALWYAVDAWLARPEWQKDLTTVIRELISVHANPNVKDDESVSPISLLEKALEEGAEERHKIETLLVLLKTHESASYYKGEEQELDQNEINLLDVIDAPTKPTENSFDLMKKED